MAVKISLHTKPGQAALYCVSKGAGWSGSPLPCDSGSFCVYSEHGQQLCIMAQHVSLQWKIAHNFYFHQ